MDATIRSLYWFSGDLRTSDNQGLSMALHTSTAVACVYIIDPAWTEPNEFGLVSLGEVRMRFLRQGLEDLSQVLTRKFRQKLHIMTGDPVEIITRMVGPLSIDRVLTNAPSGYYERNQVSMVRDKLEPSGISLETFQNSTLFEEEQFPFEVSELPVSFTGFRKWVEKLPVRPMDNGLEQMDGESLPSRIEVNPDTFGEFEVSIQTQSVDLPDSQTEFIGGETQGINHLEDYFSHDDALRYKETRNALDGVRYSTQFSPWLANGNISPVQIYHRLKEYEAERGANNSTYWIYFELLWREYFYWYGIKHGKKLFLKHGIGRRKSVGIHNERDFNKWCQGLTKWPLVNACMNQMNATGFMSNRGRQIAASCLINELNVDWRFGAAWFEQQLIDYDPASNWGNWQYIAGVGADPRGGRHFSIDKQQKQFDPDFKFIEKWTLSRRI